MSFVPDFLLYYSRIEGLEAHIYTGLIILAILTYGLVIYLMASGTKNVDTWLLYVGGISLGVLFIGVMGWGYRAYISDNSDLVLNRYEKLNAVDDTDTEFMRKICAKCAKLEF